MNHPHEPTDLDLATMPREIIAGFVVAGMLAGRNYPRIAAGRSDVCRRPGRRAVLLRLRPDHRCALRNSRGDRAERGWIVTITPGICAVPQCLRRIRSELLMCKRHWVRVPPATQVDVMHAWRLYQSGNVDLEELRRVQAGAVEAVAAVGERGGQR